MNYTVHLLGLQILVTTGVASKYKNLKGMSSLWGTLQSAVCLVLIIRPADVSLHGECAQEDKDKAPNGQLVPQDLSD